MQTLLCPGNVSLCDIFFLNVAVWLILYFYPKFTEFFNFSLCLYFKHLFLKIFSLWFIHFSFLILFDLIWFFFFYQISFWNIIQAGLFLYCQYFKFSFFSCSLISVQCFVFLGFFFANFQQSSIILLNLVSILKYFSCNQKKNLYIYEIKKKISKNLPLYHSVYVGLTHEFYIKYNTRKYMYYKQKFS